MTAAPATDPLGTIPLFGVKIPLTPAREGRGHPRDTRRARCHPPQRRELGRHEHQLITDARTAGATWQQIAARLGYKDRQSAQQHHQALARALKPPSQTRTRQP